MKTVTATPSKKSSKVGPGTKGRQSNPNLKADSDTLRAAADKLKVTAKSKVPQERPAKEKKVKEVDNTPRTFMARITGYVPVEFPLSTPMKDRIKHIIELIKKDPNQYLMINPGYSNESMVRDLHSCYKDGLGCPQHPAVAEKVQPRFTDRDNKK